MTSMIRTSTLLGAPAPMITGVVMACLAAACGGEDPGDGSFGGGSATSTTSQTSSTGDATTSTGTTTAATTTSSSGPGGGGAGGASACSGLGDACTECEADACAEVYCDCYANVECGALSACVVNCGGTAECFQTCATQHPEGISHGALLTHCAGTVCSAACPGYVPLTPCQECLYTECQPEMNDCISNPECTLLLYCLDGCTDAGCTNDCYFEYPDGTGDAGPVGTCLQDQCATECQ